MGATAPQWVAADGTQYCLLCGRTGREVESIGGQSSWNSKENNLAGNRLIDSLVPGASLAVVKWPNHYSASSHCMRTVVVNSSDIAMMSVLRY